MSGVQDLIYLKQGGRITTAAQTMGTLLKLKPLLVIQGDKLDAYAKVRGVQACQEKEIEAMQKYVQRKKQPVGRCGSLRQAAMRMQRRQQGGTIWCEQHFRVMRSPMIP